MKYNEYHIKRFAPEHRGGLSELLMTSFGVDKKDIDDLVKWKFEQPGIITYVALSGGDVVSQYSNFPMELLYNGETLSCGLCLDMATDPKHRRKGLISALSKHVYKDALQDKRALSFGFSNQEGVKVDKYSQGYGYQILGTFSKYTTVVIRPPKVELTWKRVSEFDVPRIPNSKKVHIRKSNSYLKWRYVDKPNNAYEIYALYNSSNKKIAYIVLSMRPRSVQVMDVIPCIETSDSLMKNIVMVIERMAFEKRVFRIVYSLFGNTVLASVLSQRGYRQKTAISKKFHYVTVKPLTIPEHKLIPDEKDWDLLLGDIL